jgi:hypothetical protein
MIIPSMDAACQIATSVNYTDDTTSMNIEVSSKIMYYGAEGVWP